jgi:DNA repair exonuclease SbcCD ATPase subunit
VFRRHIESRFLAGVLALWGAFGIVSVAEGTESGRFYCCTDAAGMYVCGDILPQACYGRAYRELGANGRTLREFAAPLSAEQRAEQRARQAAEEEKRKQEAIVQKEQQLKDEALLATYSNLNDLESMRKRALGDVNQVIGNIEARIAEIKALRKKYEDEAEFYQKKAVPPEIEKGLADTEFEIKAQESIIEAKKKDLTDIEAKFEEDRKRFLDLRRGKK